MFSPSRYVPSLLVLYLHFWKNVYFCEQLYLYLVHKVTRSIKCKKTTRWESQPARSLLATNMNITLVAPNSYLKSCGVSDHIEPDYILYNFMKFHPGRSKPHLATLSRRSESGKNKRLAVPYNLFSEDYEKCLFIEDCTVANFRPKSC